jgi:hypothetical protein
VLEPTFVSVASRSPRKQLLALCGCFARGRSPGLSGVVEWRVRTGGRLERFQLLIGRGRCTLIAPQRRADVTLDLSQEDLGALLDGRANGPELFARQRLVISGDVLLASRLPGLFMTE